MHPLLLVRHASSRPLSGAPSSRWGLSADGIRSAMVVGDHLPDRTPAILSGTEPVASQTARAIASARGDRTEVVLDDRLDEVLHPGPFDLDDVDTILRYLGGESVPGWEPHEQATARMTAAVRDAQSIDLDAPVVVTSGLLLALWLAPRVGIDVVTLWTRMAFPDVWSYDPSSNRVTHLPHRVDVTRGVGRVDQLPRRLQTPSSGPYRDPAPLTAPVRSSRSGQAVSG